MPAAYSTGAATSPTNALQALVTFLVAQGWTTDHSAAEGAGWRAHLHKGSMYVNFRAAVNEGGTTIWSNSNTTQGYALHMNAGTGYDSGEEWYDQPGRPESAGAAPVGVGARLLAGTLASHHFFDDGADNIVAVFETNANVFTYLAWGPSLNKGGGSWSGGMYFCGSWGHLNCAASGSTLIPGDTLTARAPFQGLSNQGSGQSASTAPPVRGFVRADVDTFTGKWLGGVLPNTGSSGNNSGYTGKHLVSDFEWDSTLDPIAVGGSDLSMIPSSRHLRRRLTAAVNNQAFLLPVRLYCQRDDGNYGFLGWADSLFAAQLNGYAPKDVVSMGGQDYMLFSTFAVLKGA